MTSPSASSNHLEWEALVGRALLRFGDIEYVSVRCISLIPADRISATASKMDFSRRTDLLIEILDGRKELTGPLSRLRDGFKRAKVLAKTRNLIAHNPLMLNLYVNPETQESMSVYQIDSARSSEHSISLTELKEYTAQVDDLAAEMWMNLMNVSGDDHQLWKEMDHLPQS